MVMFLPLLVSFPKTCLIASLCLSSNAFNRVGTITAVLVLSNATEHEEGNDGAFDAAKADDAGAAAEHSGGLPLDGPSNGEVGTADGLTLCILGFSTSSSSVFSPDGFNGEVCTADGLMLSILSFKTHAERNMNSLI